MSDYSEQPFTLVLFDALSTYRTYLVAIESELGRPWQPTNGYTDGTSFALMIPSGLENLVPDSYERVSPAVICGEPSFSFIPD